MELNEESPPPLLWPQFQASFPRRRRLAPSPLLSPPVLIILFLLAVLLVAFFVIPSVLSVTSTILRPGSVKKSWDSLNVFFVLFAILCGVLARRNEDVSSRSMYNEVGGSTVADGFHRAGEDIKPVTVSPPWFGDDLYAANDDLRATGTARLRRSSSIPDLRQVAFQETGDYRSRSYDDFEVNQYRTPAAFLDHGLSKVRQRERIEIEEPEAKVIPVDTFELRPSPSPLPPPQPQQSPGPPPPPPPPETYQKPKRLYQSVKRKEKQEKTRESCEADSAKRKTTITPPPPPPPPPPPAPPPLESRVTYETERKQGRSGRIKRNATKEIKMVLASFYSQRKRKRTQKAKNENNNSTKERHDFTVTEQKPNYYYPTIPPPSPPPPPPPPPPPLRSSQSVFYGLFKKGSKHKKIHSVPAPSPPPPPPPPPPRLSKRKIHMEQTSAAPPPPAPLPRRWPGRPPLPPRPTASSYEESLNCGNQSPLIPMPPPPPPPPFKMPEMKFVYRGGFAKIRSNQSSRSSSPEREEIDIGLDELEKASRSDGGGKGPSCPSPDVNVKADSFIARLRDEWRLERMNSTREKRETCAV